MNKNRLLLALATVQAFGALCAILTYFEVTPASFSPAIRWMLLTILGAGIALARYTNLPGSRLVLQQGRASDPRPKASTHRSLLPAVRSLEVHIVVTLTAWSILASFVVFMATHITGFYLVALAPVWVGIGGFAAARIAAGSGVSSVMLGGLLCGLFGAWLGSVGDGETGTQMGLVWGCMSGSLIASYFVRGNAYMGLLSSLISTAIFFGLTLMIIRSAVTYMLGNLGGFVQTGFPLLVCEALLALTIYLFRRYITRHYRKATSEVVSVST